MAIDDPVGIVIKQIEQQSEDRLYLPSRLTQLGISAVTATTLAQWPFFSQILTSLVMGSSSRFEERLLVVIQELHAQQLKIEGKITDKTYYESEEFHALLTLILERLHATYQKEKLRMFGVALANSGSNDCKKDPCEDFIRILRDLSLADLEELRTFTPPSANDFQQLKDVTPERRFGMRRSQKGLQGERLSRASRLIALGLLDEAMTLKDFSGWHDFHSENELKNAVSAYLAKATIRSYELSSFGWRFLQFIESNT